MQLPLCVKRSYICCRYILQVRFLADLVNCHVVTINSLFLMFDTFVDVCLEDNVPQVRQHNSQITMLLTYDEKCTDDTITRRCSLQVRADWYVYAVLSSLPWVGRELIDKKGPEFERMLDTIEGYIM